MSFAARRSASAAARSLKKGGVAERLRRCREASADREAGVVFRWRTKPQGGRKTTPTASTSVASQHFLDDAATPPCSDARRGMTHQRNSFTSSFRRLLQRGIDIIQDSCTLLFCAETLVYRLDEHFGCPETGC